MGCIGGEIYNDLVDLGRVGEDGGEIRSEHGTELDGSGKGGANQLECFFDDGLKRADLAFLLARTAEGQNPANQIGGTKAGLGDFPETLLDGVIRRKVGDGEFRISGDGQENVVEIVSDSASEGTQTLQLLRAQTQLVGSFTLGDVRDRPHHVS